jgi:hypothetical protein
VIAQNLLYVNFGLKILSAFKNQIFRSFLKISGNEIIVRPSRMFRYNLQFSLPNSMANLTHIASLFLAKKKFS